MHYMIFFQQAEKYRQEIEAYTNNQSIECRNLQTHDEVEQLLKNTEESICIFVDASLIEETELEIAFPFRAIEGRFYKKRNPLILIFPEKTEIHEESAFDHYLHPAEFSEFISQLPNILPKFNQASHSINACVIDEIASLGAEYLHKQLQTLDKQMLSEMSHLEESIHNNDYKSISHHAHILSGSVSVFGAFRLSALLGEMERQALKESNKFVNSLLKSIQDEAQLVNKALNHLKA